MSHSDDPQPLSEVAEPILLTPEELAEQFEAELLLIKNYKPPPSPSRLLLMGFVAVVSAWYVFTSYGEVAYYFHDSAPIELGSAMEMKITLDAEGKPSVPTLAKVESGSFVRITGIPIRPVVANTSATSHDVSKHQVFFQLMGIPLFGNEVRETFEARQGETGKKGTLSEPTLLKPTALEGQLIHFSSEEGREYETLRNFFGDSYFTEPFCSALSQQEIRQRVTEHPKGGLFLRGEQDGELFSQVQLDSHAEFQAIDFPDGGQVGFAVGSEGSIFKSDDGGRAWRKLSAPAQGRTLYDVAFFSDLQTGVIIGEGGLLLRTTDGGLHFDEPYPHLSDALLSVLRVDEQTLVASGKGGQIFRSEDRGVSWSPQPIVATPDLKDILRVPNGAIVAVGADGSILRSEDEGLSWAWMVSGSRADLHSLALSSTGRLIAVGDHGTVLYSDDGGFQWSRGAVPRVPNLPMSDDGKDSRPFHYLKYAHFQDVAIHPDGQRVIFVGDEGTFAVSLDGGETVSLRSGAYASTPILDGIDFNLDASLIKRHSIFSVLRTAATLSTHNLQAVSWIDHTTLLIVGDGGFAAMSIDGGLNWGPYDLPLERVAAAYVTRLLSIGGKKSQIFSALKNSRRYAEANLKDVLFVTPKHGVIAGEWGTLLETLDGGKTWNPHIATTRSILSLRAAADNRLILFSGRSGLWGARRAKDGKWLQLDQPKKKNPHLPAKSLSIHSILLKNHPKVSVAPPPLKKPIKLISSKGISDEDLLFNLNIPPAKVQLPPLPKLSKLDPLMVTDRLRVIHFNPEAGVHVPLWSAPPIPRLNALSVARQNSPGISGPLVAISVGANGRLLRSINGGESFRIGASGVQEHLYAVGMSDNAEQGYIGGANGVLLKGREALLHWSPVKLDTVEDIHGISVDTKDPSRVLIVAGTQIWLTKDGGNTFKSTMKQSAFPFHALSFAQETGHALAVGSAGIVARSNDRGDTWKLLPKPSDDILTAAWIGQGNLLLVGTDMGAIYLSTDDGMHWSKVSPAKKEKTPVRGIAFEEKTGRAWAVLTSGEVLRSSDKAKTWNTLPRITNAPMHGLFQLKESGQLWFTGSNQTLLHTVDGERWAPTPVITTYAWEEKQGIFSSYGWQNAESIQARPPANFHTIALIPRKKSAKKSSKKRLPELIAVGTEGTIAKSLDGGRTWKIRRASDEKQPTLHVVAFDPSGKYGIAAGRDGEILRSHNRGDDWYAGPEMEGPFDVLTGVALQVGKETRFALFGAGGQAVFIDDMRLKLDAPPPSIFLPGLEDIRGITQLSDGSLVAVGGNYDEGWIPCVPGYVIVVGERPEDQWPNLLIIVLVGAFGLFSGIKLTRHLITLSRE